MNECVEDLKNETGVEFGREVYFKAHATQNLGISPLLNDSQDDKE